MHCQVLLVVVDNTVWEQHEFDDLETLCVIAPHKDPVRPEPPQPHDPEPQPHPTMPTTTEEGSR